MLEYLKREVVKLMEIKKEEGRTSDGKPNGPILGLRDIKKVGRILKDIFSIVITTTMTNFDVLRILADLGSSCDIM